MLSWNCPNTSVNHAAAGMPGGWSGTGIVVAILAAAAVAARLSWHRLGPWVALAIAFAAGLAAVVVYRVRPAPPPVLRKPVDDASQKPMLLRRN